MIVGMSVRVIMWIIVVVMARGVPLLPVMSLHPEAPS
jgi:hypothetical protein